MIMDRIAVFLVIIGALNWGSVGIFNYDIIANLLTSSVSRVIFTIVGLAAYGALRSCSGKGKLPQETKTYDPPEGGGIRFNLNSPIYPQRACPDRSNPVETRLFLFRHIGLKLFYQLKLPGAVFYIE
jgi:uncharacterized membrane protein YuzA (DUF378 family)